MRKLIEQTLSSTGLRQSALTIVGNTAATGISAIALIIISRLLGPTQFGEFSVGFAIVLMVSRLNDAGLSATLLKYTANEPDHKQANLVLSLTTRYKLVLSVMIVAIGLLLIPWLSQVLNFHHPDLLAASFIFGVVTVYYEQLLAALQSFHEFTKAVIVNAIQSATKLAAVFIFFVAGIHSSTLIFSTYMVAPISAVLLSKWLMPPWVRLNLWVRNDQVRRKITNMALHSAVAFISAGIIENVDVLFVQRYMNSYETGLLSGVSKIAMVFALVAYSLGNVLNPRVTRYKTKEHLSSYLNKSWIIVGLTVLGFIAFLPFARWFILLTIGGEYLAGLPILIILVAASFLALASMPFIALFYSFDASWYFSISGVAQLAIVLLGNLLFVPRYGLAAAAWTRLATRLFLFGFSAGVGLYLYYRKYVQNTARPT